MLVITRRIGEIIRIGDDITLVVLDVYRGSGGRTHVRLGIEAPKDVPIRRDDYVGPVGTEKLSVQKQ